MEDLSQIVVVRALLDYIAVHHRFFLAIYLEHEKFCNLSAGFALNARFTTNGICMKNNTIYMWREQAITE